MKAIIKNTFAIKTYQIIKTSIIIKFWAIKIKNKIVFSVH